MSRTRRIPKWAETGYMTKKERSRMQEQRIAHDLAGRETIGSGNKMESGDVSLDDLRIKIEAKRTDKESISIKKEWLVKAREELLIGKEPVLEIEIQDERWYMIPHSSFKNFVAFLRGR